MSTQPSAPEGKDAPAPVAIPSYINDAMIDLETKKVISTLYVEFASRLPAQGEAGKQGK